MGRQWVDPGADSRALIPAHPNSIKLRSGTTICRSFLKQRRETHLPIGIVGPEQVHEKGDVMVHTPQLDRRSHTILIALLCALVSMLVMEQGWASNTLSGFSSSAFDSIKNDYKNFYSGDRLTRFAFSFGAGALLANTNADSNIQSWYQDEVRNATTDNISSIAKVFGEGKYLIPVSLLASGLFYYDGNSKAGQWGWRTTRAYLSGGPAMLAMQYVTGGARPDERNDASRWRPFQDSNGVSGHAFIGAVPFLTIGEMSEDNRWVKYTAYLLSTAPAWSRINDNAHFLSQAALGWYLAWESVHAVQETELQKGTHLALSPLIGDRTIGIALTSRW